MATTQTVACPRQDNIFAPKAPTSYGTPAAIQQIRPYKDFLTPHLHRRFINASLLVLAACWFEATLMSHGGWLWSWFSFGFTGIRALLLFMPCLAVFIVRVMNMRVGERMTISGVETIWQLAKERQTYFTVGWYLYSAWFFGEVYIWSRAANGNLGWVDHGRAYERPRLNENPIALRSLYICLAVAQAGLHLYRDYDRIPMPEKEVATSHSEQQPASKVPKPLLTIANNASVIAQRTVNLALSGIVFSAVIYFAVIRRTAWSWAYAIGRTLFRQLPPKASPTGFIHVVGLMWQALFSSVMLILLWELSNTIFTIFVTEPPLKRGQPLTSEVKDTTGMIVSRSKDPNGSLLNGLKAKKETPRSFAFWELHLICTLYEARRKTFFADVDRKGGSSWTQVCALCLAELSAIQTRIRTAQEPVEFGEKQRQAELQRKQQEHLIAQQRAQQLGLPKIANRTAVQDGDVLAKQKLDYKSTFGNMAKSVGQAPNAHNPLTPRAKRAIEYTADKALTQEQRQSWFTRQGLDKETKSKVVDFLRLPLGEPFRQNFARRVCATIFGQPHSDRTNIFHAAKSIVKLALASLKEDDYGQAAKDVPAIVRTFATTITVAQTYVAGTKPDWTDVTFQERSRQVKEVDELLALLKGGLEELLLSFSEYATSLGLSKRELREAKEAVGKGQEMAKT